MLKDGESPEAEERNAVNASLATSPRPPALAPSLIAGLQRRWPLWLAVALLALPTIIGLAKGYWGTEEGAHGPIVLATGIWLMMRHRAAAMEVAERGSALVTGALLAVVLPIYVFGRIVGVMGLEAFAAYVALLVVLYGEIGLPALKRMWFPILYMLFLIPLPDTVVTAVTQPMKIGISEWVAWTLQQFGMPIVRSGVIIHVAQYELLVAAACSGLNSLISLSAIGLFYVYFRHAANWRYALLLVFAIIPVALFANFIRVMILVLLTYFLGDAAAQGYLHDFAGLTMFVVAVLTIFAIDALLTPVRNHLARKAA